MNKASHRITCVLGAGLLAGSFALAHHAAGAEGMAPSATVEQVVRANSDADHSALAQSYEEEAKALDAKAEQHKELARTYVRLGYLKDKPEMVSHCDSLADKYRAAASDNRSLAKAHRELAELRRNR